MASERLVEPTRQGITNALRRAFLVPGFDTEEREERRLLHDLKERVK